ADELEEAFSSENRKKIALIIAETISLALTNMDMREKLYEQSVRDPLTNLYNRRYMEETLDREIRLAEHKHTSLGVIMIDIDHFKNFNDNFGHEAGDEVLKNIGWLMQSQARVGNIACRYGGEEFVIILPDSTLSDSWQRMDALRTQIDQLNLSSNGKELSGISISGGLVEFPTNGKTSSQLLQAADQALYRAKAAGRNRIETAGRLLPTE
ncbi:MAG: GGDEF domain-containing protein, partial [Bellilinea sp.]